MGGGGENRIEVAIWNLCLPLCYLLADGPAHRSGTSYFRVLRRYRIEVLTLLLRFLGLPKVLGPIAGGFISEHIGYHWILCVHRHSLCILPAQLTPVSHLVNSWILAIAGGAAGIVGVLTLRETYAPVILARKAARLRRETGNWRLETIHERQKRLKGLKARQILLANMTRPFVLLLTPICFGLSLYMALLYGYLYLLFVTFPDVYENTYGWSTGVAGLAYLGPGIGFLIATALGGKFTDTIYLALAARNGGRGRPEVSTRFVHIGDPVRPADLSSALAPGSCRKFRMPTLIGEYTLFLSCDLYRTDVPSLPPHSHSATLVHRTSHSRLLPRPHRPVLVRLERARKDPLRDEYRRCGNVSFPSLFLLPLEGVL